MRAKVALVLSLAFTNEFLKLNGQVSKPNDNRSHLRQCQFDQDFECNIMNSPAKVRRRLRVRIMGSRTCEMSVLWERVIGRMVFTPYFRCRQQGFACDWVEGWGKDSRESILE